MGSNSQEIKFESDDDLVHVDVNDLFRGITPSQQEILTSTTSLSTDSFQLPVTAPYIEAQTSTTFYTHSAVLNSVGPASVAYMTQTTDTMVSTTSVSSFGCYAGPYQFRVQFSQAQDFTKATPWIFSEKVNKLYAAMDKAVPIHFILENVNDVADYCHFQVRGQVHFSQAEDFKYPVVPCDTHSKKKLSTDMNAEPAARPNHFLVSESATAQYYEDENGRHSVAVHLSRPAVGETHVTLMFRFTCRGSCVGGPNRRPMCIVFTLETLQGDVLGRYSVPLRVCSCPGRDIRNDEEKLDKTDPAPPSSAPSDQESNSGVPQKGNKRKKPMKTVFVAPEQLQLPELDLAIAPSLLAAQDDDKVYYLEVRGRRRYELLRSVRDSFDFVNSQKGKS